MQASDYKILVVDDEQDLREAIAFELSRKGFQVRTAASGHEALALFREDPAHIVLSDIRMPDGDGIELLTTIKKNNVFLPVVIFLTGHSEISLEEAYDLGADAVFSKPFDRVALLEAVNRALQPSEQRFARSSSRVETDLEVGITFLDSSLHAVAKVRNLGRGGMFVQIEGAFPDLERCDFSFDCHHPIRTRVTGEGIVRWIRRTEVNADVPAGLGIEFLSFDPGCRKDMLEIINFNKTKAFIPKR